MKNFLLTLCFTLFSLNAFSQSEPTMSTSDKNALVGYEYIGEVDYLTASAGDGSISTAYKWNVHLYGKPFANTYIFKVYVTGTNKEKNKSIYTLSKNGDQYAYYPECDLNTFKFTYTKVDITNYKYKTKVKDGDGYDISLYLNLPF